VDLVQVHTEIHALDDLGPFLGERNVEISQFEQCHLAHASDRC
jgi:hypothetical protein